MLRSVRRRRLLVLVCLAAALYGGHWFVRHVPPRYSSVATLKLTPAQPARPGFTAGVDIAGRIDRVSDYTVIGSAVRSPQVRETALIRGQRNPIEFVRSHLKVAVAGPDELKLSILSDKPDDARTLIDAVAAAYIRSTTVIDLDSVTKPVATADSVSSPIRIQASVVSPATTDWATPLPSRAQVYIAAVLIGLVAGVVLARVRDGISPKLQGPLEAAGAARSRCLGSVPPLPRSLSTPALRGQSVLVEPSGKITAAWNRVAACLNAEFVDKFDRVILFTAPGKSRGKSLAASNAAIAMARAGNRVVLVDGHGNRPAVGEIFGDTLEQNPRPEQSVGLADVLRGRVQLDAALKPTGLPMLEVLTCGSGPAARAAELNTPEFGRLLDQLCERFDRVVVDAGPAETAECAVLSAWSDVAVLIADRRAGRRRQFRAAAASVRSVGSRLAGVVWTSSPRRFRHISTAACKPDSGTSIEVAVMSVSSMAAPNPDRQTDAPQEAKPSIGQMPGRGPADDPKTNLEETAAPNLSPS